jgi:hypothetical protein
MARRNRIGLAFILLSVLLVCDVTARRSKATKGPPDDDNDLGVPHVHFLVDMIGREMYQNVNTPKNKILIFMTIGKLPCEQSTIAFLSTFCNVCYGISVLLGFVFLDRTYMLVGTLLTLYVGPAIILVLLGIVGGALVAFAVAPVLSVLIIWFGFFLTSQMAQMLGSYLGLDSDGDGDVDYLDLLHWAASKRLGKLLGLAALYKFLKKLNTDPFIEIHKKLDCMSQQISRKKDM